MNKHITLGILIIGLVFGQVTGQTPIAEGKTKFLGNIYSSSQLKDFEQYWNQVVPENAGKWGSVERTRDTFDWTELDAAYKFAKDNGYVFRFHVLLWGNQQPSWIEDLSDQEQLEEITEWMDAVAERYPDIDYLEVANEPTNDPPSGAGNGNYINSLGGFGTSGYDWLVTAFGMARERFPNAKLMINEYNIVNDKNRASRYLKAINELKKDGLIDVIGVQAHAFSTTGSTTVIDEVLDMLAETELPIMVTEMDIDGPTDQKQLEDYERVFPVFWEHPSVIGVTLWGFRPGLWRNAEKAYLIGQDGRERPAMEWLRNYVESTDEAPKPLDATSIGDVSVYPNPVTTSTLKIKSQRPISSVEVMDVSGRIIREVPGMRGAQLEIDFTHPAGVYLIKVHAGSDQRVLRVVVR